MQKSGNRVCRMSRHQQESVVGDFQGDKHMWRAGNNAVTSPMLQLRFNGVCSAPAGPCGK